MSSWPISTIFRGAGAPDSGTALEVGFAVALGKPVWGYADDGRAVIDRVVVRRDTTGAYCEKGIKTGLRA